MKIFRVYENYTGGCQDSECIQRFRIQETCSYHNNYKGAQIAISKMIKIKVDEALKRGLMRENNLYNLRSNRTNVRIGTSNSPHTSFARYEIEEIDVIETEDDGLPMHYNQYGLYDGR